MITREQMRAHQIAYDNRMPDESGPWCEGYGVPSCDLGTEDTVSTYSLTYTLCPTCRAAAEAEALGGSVHALRDAAACLPTSADESHTLAAVRAAISTALRMAVAERDRLDAIGGAR